MLTIKEHKNGPVLPELIEFNTKNKIVIVIVRDDVPGMLE